MKREISFRTLAMAERIGGAQGRCRCNVIHTDIMSRSDMAGEMSQTMHMDVVDARHCIDAVCAYIVRSLAQGRKLNFGEFSLSLSIRGTVDGANGDKVFDLTLMFGSTIADYIYGLGNTNGVAWFRSLFPSATYAYNAGTLYSVNPDKSITKSADQSETSTYELNHPTLYGLFKLDASNKLYADGDTYEHDGAITRKYAVVDLGDLFYTYNSTNKWFSTSSIDTLIKRPSGGNTVANIFTDQYDRISRTALGNDLTLDLRVAVSTAGSVIIRDLSYTDADVFKTAMAGHKLVYELATPTTETAATFDEKETVYQGGTEALTDYAYEQGTRDVAVPVGHSTVYLREMIMVPAPPLLNGTYTLTATVNNGSTVIDWQ